MTSILSLEDALKWIAKHNQYHDFQLERQPSGGFAVMFKEFRDSDCWRYIP